MVKKTKGELSGMKDIPYYFEQCTWCPDEEYHKLVCLKERENELNKLCDNKTIGVQLYKKTGHSWTCKLGMYCPKCGERLDI